MITANPVDRAQSRQQEQSDPSHRGDESSGPIINIGRTERWVSTGAGALLALYGLKRLRPASIFLAGAGAALMWRGVSGHCNVYAALGVNGAAGDGAQAQEYFENGIHVEESFSIIQSPEQLYQFWRRFENLPQFMKHLESVQQSDGNRSHWIAKGPAGMSLEWDAEIINDEPNRLIAWRSLGGADVDNAGSVRFIDAPGGRGTEVAVTLDYIPAGGKAGSWLAKLFGGDADQIIREDLRRFKQLMETGEIPTIEGQSRGTCR